MASGENDSSREEVLKQAEERLRSALDSIADGAWDWNCVTKEIFYSDRWLSSLGYDRSDLKHVTSDWGEIVHPEDRELVSDAMSAHLKEYTPHFDLEYRMRRKDGTYRWTIGRGRVIERAPDGTALRFVGTNSDITARKKAEWALERAEGRSRTILEIAPCVIVCVDSEHRVLELNRAAEELYGYTIEELRGKNYLEWCLTPEQRSQVSDQSSMLLAGVDGVSGDSPVVTRDGSERLISWRGARILDTKGEAWGIVGVGIDVTDLRRSEREREAALREREIALDRVRLLTGVMPSCRECGRVRSSTGVWATLTEHLEHAEAVEPEAQVCPHCSTES